jgi:hypothetical protein
VASDGAQYRLAEQQLMTTTADSFWTVVEFADLLNVLCRCYIPDKQIRAPSLHVILHLAGVTEMRILCMTAK